LTFFVQYVTLWHISRSSSLFKIYDARRVLLQVYLVGSYLWEKEIMEFKIIQVKWGKPTPIPKGEEREMALSVLSTGAGLYAAYADHDVYGRNVLVYIGKTVHFDVRTRQHTDGILANANNLSIAFGKLIQFPDENESDGIDVAEQILIASLKPAYNRQNIHQLGDKKVEKGYIVQNLEERGSLPLEATNYWWLPEEIRNQ